MAVSTARRSRSTRVRAASDPHDAIVYLKADHREVERLFKAFESAGERAHKTRRKLVDRIIAELSIHASIEERVLYPSARDEIPAARGDVLEALEEHHVVKWQLQELVGMDPTDERYTPKVVVLMENVRHHVEEEENVLFPVLRANLPRRRLLDLGAELREAKRVAPELPHPRLPGLPSEHIVPDALTTMIDKTMGVVKSVRAAS